MEYRFLPHGGDKISVIGLGSGSITGTEQEMVDIINTAIEKGINYFDMAPSVQAPFLPMQRPLPGEEKKLSHKCILGLSIKMENMGGQENWMRLKTSLTGN